MPVTNLRKEQAEFLAGKPVGAAEAVATSTDEAPQPTAKVMRGKKAQIALYVAPETLAQLDAKAADLDISRNALITLGIKAILRGELDPVAK